MTPSGAGVGLFLTLSQLPRPVRPGWTKHTHPSKTLFMKYHLSSRTSRTARGVEREQHPKILGGHATATDWNPVRSCGYSCRKTAVFGFHWDCQGEYLAGSVLHTVQESNARVFRLNVYPVGASNTESGVSKTSEYLRALSPGGS